MRGGSISLTLVLMADGLLRRHDGPAVHVRPTILHLDEHRAEFALPQIAEHAFRSEWQAGLKAHLSAQEDFRE